MSGHNHITRDIKPLGQCPACDAYHDRRIPKPASPTAPDRACDAGEKWKAELAAEREGRQRAVESSSRFECEAQNLAAELKQTDERAQYWIAEAARLRGLLERVLNGKVHIGELCQALERKP